MNLILNYLAFNVACSRAQTSSQLLAFRFLAGLGGSAPLSIGGGTIADLWAPEERGMAMGLYSLAPLVSISHNLKLFHSIFVLLDRPGYRADCRRLDSRESYVALGILFHVDC